MSLRGLLVLVVLMAALAFALFRWRGAKEEVAPPPELAPVLAEFAVDSVRSIEAACDDSSFVLRRAGAGAWTLTSPVQAEADPREVRVLLDALRGARARKVIAPGGADGAAYGLDPASCSVRVDLDGDAAGRRLTLGRTSPVGYERYARAADGSVVFVDGSLYTAVARAPEAFRERRLLPLDPSTIARLEIERPAGRVVLVRADGGWRLDAPVRDAADRQEAERAAEAATSLEIDHGVAPSRPMEAAPARRIALRADGHVAYVAAAGVEGKRVAWRDGGGWIGLVPDSALADLDRPAAAFRDRQVLSFSSPEARRVVVTRGGTVLTIARASEQDPWTAADGDALPAAVDGARVHTLLDRLRAVRAVEVVDGAAPSPPTGTILVAGDAGDLARASWGPLPPVRGEEIVWVTTPARGDVFFRVPASSFGPIPARGADLAAP